MKDWKSNRHQEDDRSRNEIHNNYNKQRREFKN